ncbi:MAG: signal peptidase II [Clostridia bacterium]|nr:signal peptidase II [Clostridia bacterium]
MSVYIVLIAAALLTAIDQITKYVIINNIPFGSSVEILPGIVDFTYIHNQGAAFGMLQGMSWVLLSVSAVVILLCLALLLRRSFQSPIMTWAITFVLAGGLGNMIDRIFRGGNVVDFIELKFIDFAIFNFADICVTFGAMLIVLEFILELWRDFKKSKKLNEEETL